MSRTILPIVLILVLALATGLPASASSVSPWQPLAAPGGEPILVLAASPDYTHDHTLFAATPAGLFRSADRGATWSPLADGPGGPIANALGIVPSPAYDADQTLFVLAGPPHQVLRSRDAGASWDVVWQDGPVYDLAISPGFATDQTLFLAGGEYGQDQLRRSTNGGDTWTALGDLGGELDAFYLALSPNYLLDGTLFVAGFGPTLRSVDRGATWQRLPAPAPARGLLVSPNFASDYTLWVLYREIEGSALQPESGVARSTDGGDTWTIASAGLPGNYNMNYRSLAADPSGSLLAVALGAPEWDPRFPPRLYLSDSAGQRWAPQALLPGGAAPSLVLLPGPLPELLVVAGGTAYRYGSGCYEALADGGFETDPDLLAYHGIGRAWTILDTQHLASYTLSPHLEGAWAMRSGILGAQANRLSYSSFEQPITIPAGATSAELAFSRYPVLGDPLAMGAKSTIPADVLATTPDTADFHYLLSVYADGSYRVVASWRDDSQEWLATVLDLSPDAGRTVRLRFGTYNNGTGGPSAMVVDAASVTICRAIPQPRTFLPMVVVGECN